MSKWYGSVVNRVEEGRNFTGRELHVGDDITMYHWSDRTCYYITEIVSDKCIKVREWHVCADHDKAGGMGNQNWLFFKTRDEEDEYLHRFFPDISPEHNEEPEPEVWVFRYGKWMREFIFTEDNYCTERELKSLEKHGFYKRYCDLSGRISFGVRNYYYDWEF